MRTDRLTRAINRVNTEGEPRIEIIKRAIETGARLGVFASSFNPPTIAHLELMRRAARSFSLDEVIALAGKSNADKTDYECSLEDRIIMLELALASDARASIGLSSHAFYVDMIDALGKLYPSETELHFILGFDTFARVLDRENRYTAKYYHDFSDRAAALKYLTGRSRLIVAARAGAGLRDIHELIESEKDFTGERVLFLDFPDELGELSATEARNRAGAGLSISGLVPAEVERYIHERRLYKSNDAAF
jgi:nicotinate (nicotinamide) nucleotide adenylyltransferase